MSGKTYSDSPAFIDFCESASKGIIFTGFSDDSSIRVYFTNYPDASLAARKLTKCDKEVGRVFQTIHNDADATTFPGMQTDGDIKIEKGKSPVPTPTGQFSLFYVPLTMESKAAEYHFAKMNAAGKLHRWDIPTSEARDILLHFKHGLDGHAIR